MADEKEINGNVYSWSSIELKLDGGADDLLVELPYVGVTKIKYNEKIERALVYGLGKSFKPLGMTRGKYSADSSLTMRKHSAEALRKALAAKSADGATFGEVSFQAIVSYSEPGSNQEPIVVEINGCRIAGTGGDHSEGADGLEEEVPLTVLSIVTNGRTLYSKEAA